MKTCPNCGRPVFGFWKYGAYIACRKQCFRELIATGKIPRLLEGKEYPELGIQNEQKAQA